MYYKHPQFNSLENNESLFKYMPIERFKDLIEKSSLYFRKISKFLDDKDGSFENFNEEDLNLLKKFTYEMQGVILTTCQKYREVTYASCFTLDTSFNHRFIEEYLNNKEGVIIKTSGDKLHNSIIDNKQIFSSTIDYNDLRFKIGNVYYNLYNKLKEFSWESEYRLFYAIEDLIDFSKLLDVANNNNTDGLNIEIDVNTLIENLYYFGDNFDNFNNEYSYLNKPIIEYIQLAL
ncbi:hypothetical protein ACTS9E_04390 [Empedobacter brevis]